MAPCIGILSIWRLNGVGYVTAAQTGAVASRFSLGGLYEVLVHDLQRPPHHTIDDGCRLAWTHIDSRGFEQPRQHRLFEPLLIGMAHHFKCLQARARQDDMMRA